jgi:tetratricopeptide (TPR) repeat protein
MYQRVVSENHPQAAEAYNNLGGVQEAQGKYAAAESYYEKALKVRLDRLGPQHLAVAESYSNLSAVRKAQGKLVEGERLSRQALEIRRLLRGDHYHLTGQSYKNLGLALYVQGKYEEAESEWVRAVDNFRSARLHISFAGLDRAAFAGERSPLPFLAAVLARNGKPVPAWDHLEENLARGLFDDLSTGQLRPLSEAATPADAGRQAARNRQAQLHTRR